MLLFISVGTIVQAQKDDGFIPTPLSPEHQMAMKECKAAQVSADYRLFFKDGIDGFIELAAPIKGAVTFAPKGKGREEKAVQEPNVYILQNLRPDTEYAVFAPNACGEKEIIKVFNTSTKRSKDDLIQVSNEMFQTLSNFDVKNGRVSLRQYLADSKSTSLYQRMSFYQQFSLQGKLLTRGLNPFKAPPGDDGGDDGGGGDGDSTGDCFCQPIQNTQIAIPGGQPTAPNGDIVWDVEASPGKINLNNGLAIARYWWAGINKGAAKGQGIFSEGSTGLGTEYSAGHTTGNTSTEVSGNKSSISYLLMCTKPGSNNLEECRGCDKNLKLFYRYDTKLDAFAKLLGISPFTRRSYAAVEDFCVVTLTQGDEFEVIDAGNAQAEADCNSVPNPDFWMGIFDVAVSVAELAATSGASIPESIPDLAEGISSVLTTQPRLEKECEIEILEKNLVYESNRTVTLIPNVPVVLDLYSFSNHFVKGTRAWYNHAVTKSDFYLGGILQGGYNASSEEKFCCTSQIGNWVLASIDGIYSTDDLKKEVGQVFQTTPGVSVWNLPTGGGGVISIPTEYGVDVVNQNCNH